MLYHPAAVKSLTWCQTSRNLETRTELCSEKTWDMRLFFVPWVSATSSSSHGWTTQCRGIILAAVHSSGGLGLPKSILTLRPSLSNWLKMIWDLPVCQFPIWQRTRPRWLLGESQNVCVCQHKYACGHVCWIGLHRRFQGLWDCLKRHKECDFVLVLSCAYAHIVETSSLCSATHQDSSSICRQKLSPQTLTVDFGVLMVRHQDKLRSVGG